MARSIDDIFNIVTTKYISYEVIKHAYELDNDKSFADQFSKASFEYIIFYVIAFCWWVLESLLTIHINECNSLLDKKKPHRPKWYRDKALAFQYGRALIIDEDYYNNTGVTDATIKGEKIVKYAAAVTKGGNLYIKVAGESGGKRAQLTPQQETALSDYFVNHVQDAGVNLIIINRPADSFKLSLAIYYNPMILDANGTRLDGNDNEPIQRAINNYIANLPFNGEFSNMALTDVLQGVEGVVIPEIKASFYKYGSYDFKLINAKVTPDSGYLRINNSCDLSIEFIAYQTED